MKKTVAENLKRARKARKMSQKELAEKLSITQPQIYQYESGRRTPRIDTLMKISKILSCPLSELADADDIALLSVLPYHEEMEKSWLIRKEKEAYALTVEKNPMISHDSKVGKIVYNEHFQSFILYLLDNLIEENFHILDVKKIISLFENVNNPDSLISAIQHINIAASSNSNDQDAKESALKYVGNHIDKERQKNNKIREVVKDGEHQND